jgi:hypothetical protein
MMSARITLGLAIMSAGMTACAAGVGPPSSTAELEASADSGTGTATHVTSAARTARTCEPFGTSALADGRYIVQQNEWNSTDRQCMAVDRTAWTITRASFNLPVDGPPASYPSVFRGCHWGTCTDGHALPVVVRDLARATSTWRTRVVRSGAYNVSYDLWTNASPATEGQPDGSEIMLWLRARGGVRPAGSRTSSVRLDGARWDVWTAPMAGWEEIAYVRRRPRHSVSRLDLGAFVRDSTRRGVTDPSWYLIGVEAGFEIWRGGRGLSTADFSVSVRSAPPA